MPSLKIPCTEIPYPQGEPLPTFDVLHRVCVLSKFVDYTKTLFISISKMCYRYIEKRTKSNEEFECYILMNN